MEDFDSGCTSDRYEKFWVAEVGSAASREIVGSVALRRVDDSNEYKLELKVLSIVYAKLIFIFGVGASWYRLNGTSLAS